MALWSQWLQEEFWGFQPYSHKRTALWSLQEHEAWLDEPQEMTTFESSKTIPLLEESKDGKQVDNLKSAKDVASNYNDRKAAGSVDDRKVADKLNQV